MAAGSSTTQTQSKYIQINIVKTMMLVSLLFAITWAPVQVYYLILNVHLSLTLRESVYYAVLFIGYLYLCNNPFV